MSATAWRSEQPNLRYLPSNSKNSHFCPSETEICVFGQQSPRFGQNVSRIKFLEYVQEAMCQFSAKSVGNFSKSSKFTPQLPSINAPPVFSITLAQGALPKLATLFFWESPTQQAPQPLNFSSLANPNTEVGTFEYHEKVGDIFSSNNPLAHCVSSDSRTSR